MARQSMPIVYAISGRVLPGSGTTEERTTETLVPLHEVGRRDVPVLTSEHGVGDELGQVLTGRCFGGLGEILLGDALGTPRGHHAIDVGGLGHSNLILAAINLHAEEIGDIALVLHFPTLL